LAHATKNIFKIELEIANDINNSHAIGIFKKHDNCFILLKLTSS